MSSASRSEMAEVHVASPLAGRSIYPAGSSGEPPHKKRVDAQLYFDATRIHRYDAAPMSVALPESIDIRRFADSVRGIQGELDGALCERLLDSIDSYHGSINVDLRFSRDEQGRALITGVVGAEVVMTCQRCLEQVVVRLDSEVSLCVVTDEAQAVQLPRPFDPVVVDDEQLNIIDLIEDELLLVLPVVATHDKCEPPAMQKNAVSEAAVDQRESPFAVLKKLKV